VRIQQFVVESLGDSSYLVIGQGEAAVVDPQRDVRPFIEAARAAGVSIRYVFETHVHNDYVSGGPELAALGAQVIAPADARLTFPHRPIRDGEEVAFGGVTLRAVHTPGHTYEHTSYLAIDEEGAIKGAFAGGALLIGAAGRTDLLGPAHTEKLTLLQWESAQRLRELLAPLAEVLPTHGAGSFCSSAGTGDERRAPLSVELARNPALNSASFEVFRNLHLAAPAPIPGYYQHMAPINRRGARVFGEPPIPELLSPGELRSLAAAIRVVDVRSRADFAAAAVPGALEIEESTSMLAYVGWLLPFDSPLALVTYDESQAHRVTTDLFRIGYEQVRGYLPFHLWTEAGLPAEAMPFVGIEEAREILRAAKLPVLDVRYRNEHQLERLPGTIELPLDELPRWAERAPEGRSLIVCASGQRSAMAASFLRAHGREAVPLLEGGASDLRSP